MSFFACVGNRIMRRSDVGRDNGRPPILFTSNALYVLWQMHFGLQFLMITTISGLTVLKRPLQITGLTRYIVGTM